MPIGRGERLVFAVGSVAIAVLAALTVLAWLHQRSRPAAASAASAAEIAPQRAPTVSTALPPATAAAAKKALGSLSVDLEIAAARGASWIEVRSGTRRGKILYIGTLGRKAQRHFVADTLWVRAGAGQNVDLTVGTLTERYPLGHTDVLISRAGVRVVR